MERPTIKVNDGESMEGAIRRFKKMCEKAGVLAEVRKRESYEKPSVRRKKKSLAARKRSEKKSRGGSGGMGGGGGGMGGGKPSWNRDREG